LNPKQLEQSYQEMKQIFHTYLNSIKKNSQKDIYNIINPTLIKNPYSSEFPKNFFMSKQTTNNKKILFFKVCFKYYLKNFYLFMTYLISSILYKIYYKKTRVNKLVKIIDVFGLVDNTNKNNKFEENYLKAAYEVLDKYDTKYTILIRPYGVSKNPFKLKQFFNILNKDKRDLLLEYELLNFKDFLELLFLIVVYPFKLLRLIQNEDQDIDKLFNYSLVEDIKHLSFDSLTRYLLGKNLAKIQTISQIYSWSEFQVIERSFNYAIRDKNKNIELIALQFYLNYEIYFNSYVDDLDYDMLSSPHKVMVNGKYNILKRKKVKYNLGVSLRYKEIFTFAGIKKEKNILILGSYIEADTKYMLNSVKNFENIIFKNHPSVNISQYTSFLKNMRVSNENIYTLFKEAKLVIGTASGSSVEAVACGLSVIIIASQNNLTANPLVEEGKGKIWDIAFTENEINTLYNKLMDFRKNNKEEIEKISQWYKDNFFVEPTEKNIIKIFDLNNGIDMI